MNAKEEELEMNATEQAFNDTIQKLFDLLKPLEGKTVNNIIFVPPTKIPKENRGLWQIQPLIGIQTGDKLLCLNIERLLYNIWNDAKCGKI